MISWSSHLLPDPSAPKQPPWLRRAWFLLALWQVGFATIWWLQNAPLCLLLAAGAVGFKLTSKHTP